MFEILPLKHMRAKTKVHYTEDFQLCIKAYRRDTLSCIYGNRPAVNPKHHKTSSSHIQAFMSSHKLMSVWQDNEIKANKKNLLHYIIETIQSLKVLPFSYKIFTNMAHKHLAISSLLKICFNCLLNIYFTKIVYIKLKKVHWEIFPVSLTLL